MLHLRSRKAQLTAVRGFQLPSSAFRMVMIGGLGTQLSARHLTVEKVDVCIHPDKGMSRPE
jgi:hypothetical protein